MVRPLERFGLKYVGDAARYLSPFPENVGIRHAIRSAGLPLLRGLHRDPLRRYDRIIVVGHSLGSVIAYDVLTYLWQEMHSKVERSPQRHGKPELEELRHLKEELHHLEDSKPPPSPIDQPELNAVLEWTKPREPPADKCEQLKLNRQYRQHQRALWDEYRHANEKPGFRFPWRITDLVTLGSPLTYAEFLLAKNLTEFSGAKDQREVPTCPPRSEDERDDEDEREDHGLLNRVLPSEASERGLRILHHGAVRMHPLDEPIFPGDIIGGPLAQLFGLGVQDVELRGCFGHPMCSHVKYWAEEEESAAKALRDALNLGDKEQ